MRLMCMLFLLSAAMSSPQSPSFEGDYSGSIGALRLKLHIKAGLDGTLQGSLDSIDQGAIGLPCASFKATGQSLSFAVPSVGGNWRGTLSTDGETLTGTWTQGAEMPLTFHRAKETSPAQSKVDGIYLGALAVGAQKLRIQLRVRSESANKQVCSVDSLDQGAMGLPCENAKLDGDKFSFDVPMVKGTWTGSLSNDGNELNGTWTQGAGSLPLNMTRQASAATSAVKPPQYEAAQAPVVLDHLKEMLDADLATDLKSGRLSPESEGGIVVGVLQNGQRRVLAYGWVKQDSIFEIGSITKTFTGLILARMVTQNKVTLDEPVRELLPPGTVTKLAGAEITLLDLATQHSGLPRLPDNLAPKNPNDPYADYAPADLYAFLNKHGVSKPENPSFLYSNLGFGLLGFALAARSGLSYPALLKQEITEPLHLNETEVDLSPEQAKRLAQGHNAQHKKAGPWALNALMGAGAIRSTANDMLTYLEAQLHPEKTSFPAAFQMTHQLRADALPNTKIGLAWLYDSKLDCYWHNGATGGYSSYSAFCPGQNSGVVVLFNTSIGPTGSFADQLGERLLERLTGKPALILQ